MLGGKMIRTRTGWLTAIIVVGLLVAGCSSSKSRVGSALSLNTDLTLRFAVDSQLNPDNRELASPVFIRLYELKNAEEFEQAGFIDLYENDERVLGKSLINKQTMNRFVPGESRTERVVLRPGTRFVGLYAEFLQYQNAEYKVLIPVTENNVIRNQANVRMTGNQISIIKR
jgi:type VI secretion system protein VasD